MWLAVLLVTGCGGTPDRAAEPVTGPDGVVRIAAVDRTAPVALAGTTLSGEQLSLTQLRGRPVVVNVWGSWCAPCRVEAPTLARLAADYRPRGVAFLGINTRDQPAAARAFERRYRIPYPSLRDDGGRALLAFRGSVRRRRCRPPWCSTGPGASPPGFTAGVSGTQLRSMINPILAETA